ncbi:hypothetical protein VTN49DRAFT_1537 [Thermomyces lanuginosus]|uniref:uncharacterized protein n=1 Tax=Thermomyces lanuginosus TaxID=5541 RepID=UPI0037427FBF
MCRLKVFNQHICLPLRVILWRTVENFVRAWPGSVVALRCFAPYSREKIVIASLSSVHSRAIEASRLGNIISLPLHLDVWFLRSAIYMPSLRRSGKCIWELENQTELGM